MKRSVTLDDKRIHESYYWETSYLRAFDFEPGVDWWVSFDPVMKNRTITTTNIEFATALTAFQRNELDKLLTLQERRGLL